jgi:hypothetical protein
MLYRGRQCQCSREFYDTSGTGVDWYLDGVVVVREHKSLGSAKLDAIIAVNSSFRANWYIDSVSGDDGNAGTQAAPFATISKALEQTLSQGDVIWLKRGSVWREALTLPTGVSAIAYGTGERPILACDDAAANVDFSATAGQENVYQISWVLDLPPPYSGGCFHGVWEDDTRLAMVGSLALCQSTPGSYFSQYPMVDQTSTIYVHASDSSNVTTNGKLYEIGSRGQGVVGGARSSIIGIHTRRNVSPWSLVSYFYARDCLAEDGGYHNAWVTGWAEDVAAWKCLPSTGYGDRTMFISQFAPIDDVDNTTGVVYVRCTAVALAGEAPIGFYAHNDGVNKFPRILYDSCEASGCSPVAFGGSDVTRCVNLNCVVDGSAIVFGTVCEVKYIVGGFVDGATPTRTSQLTSGEAALVVRGFRGLMSGNAASGFVCASESVDVQESSFAQVDADGATYWLLVYSPNAGSLSFIRNVVSGFTSGFLNIGASTIVESEANVLFNSARVIRGAATYNTLPEWKAGSGQDTESVDEDPLFSGEVRDGDFGVAGESPAIALGAGATAFVSYSGWLETVTP